ncbi:MAG: hypothetical protein MR573_05945, partial [Clostridiales bacterium]|nr:hypothetical protein [Clostridiales bacterium]
GLFTPFPRSGFSPADGLDRYSFSQRSISPADCPIIKKFYPKSKSKSRVGVMRAAFSAYSPKSAAGLCAFSRKNSGGQLSFVGTLFYFKTKS